MDRGEGAGAGVSDVERVKYLHFQEDLMKSNEVMSRAKFSRHRDKMIMNLDFSDLEIDDVRKVSDYAKGVIGRMPKGSVLTLVNVTNVQYDQAFSELSGDLARHNKPYVLAGGVIGVTGWRKLLFRATSKLTGRDNLKLFDDAEAAKEWLASYPN